MIRAEPDWSHFRSFLAVLRDGSLSAAARSLGLTQPTLARHVDQLEASLGGVALFTRSPQGLAPTEAALALVPQAEAMEAAAAAALRVVSARAEELSGPVRISASDVIGAEVLPSILRDLHDAHPGLSFEVVLSNRTVDLLRRDADIAVRMVRPSQDALVARKVGDIMLGLYAGRRYLSARGTPRSIDDVDGHVLIGPDRETPSLRAARAAGFDLRREMFAYRTDSDLAQLAAIRAGCGIGVCQVGLASRTPELVRLFADRFAYPLETWIAMHGDLRGDRRMRVVFDHLSAAIASYAATCR